MTQPVPDRLQDALRKVNRALNPRQVFSMTWEYNVISSIPGPPVKIDCEAVDGETVAHLPPQLVGLELWPGPSGFVAQPQPGSIVRIAFANGDPSKPMVVGLDPAATPLLVFGFVSATMQLGDQSAQPLVHAAWLVAVIGALDTFAAALTESVTLPNVIACGATLTGALQAVPASPTTKVLGT